MTHQRHLYCAARFNDHAGSCYTEIKALAVGEPHEASECIALIGSAAALPVAPGARRASAGGRTPSTDFALVRLAPEPLSLQRQVENVYPALVASGQLRKGYVSDCAALYGS